MWTPVNKPITNEYTTFKKYSCFPHLKKKKKGALFIKSYFEIVIHLDAQSTTSVCSKGSAVILKGTHKAATQADFFTLFSWLSSRVESKKQEWLRGYADWRFCTGAISLPNMLREVSYVKPNQMWKSTKFHTFRTSFPPRAQIKHPAARHVPRASFQSPKHTDDFPSQLSPLQSFWGMRFTSPRSFRGCCCHAYISSSGCLRDWVWVKKLSVTQGIFIGQIEIKTLIQKVVKHQQPSYKFCLSTH